MPKGKLNYKKMVEVEINFSNKGESKINQVGKTKNPSGLGFVLV